MSVELTQSPLNTAKGDVARLYTPCCGSPLGLHPLVLIDVAGTYPALLEVRMGSVGWFQTCKACHGARTNTRDT